ncbi:HAD family hydrolase [Leptospira gomenensis]|uniref:phosphoglycolate phosphatase n=1 Tax=Leptospira gomenensis TaxID=2484974 RepID=A0A5F1Z0X7_9LEPT|nr:HAD family hydrolase [Leptospira gomenensis]TGK30924.1 HAD family hydrolase [Leptospira gomenensis]TGK45356.1 HAD family hydrolase [Leptospira gomenensis]TGK66269.1 HAD family hydrolase [Leptospira gomenensis]
MIQDFFVLRKEKIDSVFFDFDGVVVDSVGIKTEAYADLFKEFGNEAVDCILEYHRSNGGIDRYKKIEYVLNFMKVEYDSSLVERLASDFASLVVEKVVKCDLLPGISELLTDLSQSSIRSFVVSGTPEEELRYITKEKKLNDFFLEVCGSPKSKVEITGNLIRNYDINPSRSLFIGDAVGDFETASRFGILFLGVS